MPRPHKDDDIVPVRLEGALRQGDWNAVARLTRQLRDEVIAEDPAALAERLECLKAAIVAGRVARAGLAVSLAQARAAARFTQSRKLAVCQESADTPGF
jgi:hypothetical protein